MDPLGIDCWMRIVLLQPIASWPALFAISTAVRDAIRLARESAFYGEAAIILALSAEKTARLQWQAATHVAKFGLLLWLDPDLADSARGGCICSSELFCGCKKAVACAGEVKWLALCGTIGRFFAAQLAQTCKALQGLVLTHCGVYSGGIAKGDILRTFLKAGCFSELRMLEAGAPEHQFDTVGLDGRDDGVIDVLPQLAEVAPKLEVLNVRYSQSQGGLDYPHLEVLLRKCSRLRHLDLTMVMTWRDFNPVLEMLGELLPELESLAAGGGLLPHGLTINRQVLDNFFAATGKTLKNLQLQSCDVRPYGAPTFGPLCCMRRLNLAGTLTLLPHANIAETAFGEWLRRSGPELLELVMMCAFLGDDGLSDEELVRQVCECETFAAQCCTLIHRDNPPPQCLFSVRFTALHDSPRLKQGFPVHIMDLHKKSCVLAMDGFFRRVQPLGGLTKPPLVPADPGDMLMSSMVSKFLR
eukprot:TRINITY_DN36834_c0_g1_i1.p1 TRINITY_DN36834_c0_g1~~TRINITY_DN36834_c0_g1_i1.p1  ORF type:complete len:471 (-),score=99.01 TRINITY_DN36834_c0_g1_i1:335-1747(-)